VCKKKKKRERGREYSDRNLKDKLWYEFYESVVTNWRELPAEQKSENRLLILIIIIIIFINCKWVDTRWQWLFIPGGSGYLLLLLLLFLVHIIGDHANDANILGRSVHTVK
jgi:hypothetical protein